MLLPDEPFRPPVDDAAIGQTLWYCYHCEAVRDSESNARSHYAGYHRGEGNTDYYGTRGMDYEVGSVVLLQLLQYRQWSELVAQKFSKHMAIVSGPDDFLIEAECGDA